MFFDGNLKDLSYACTFSFDGQTYAICRDDAGECFCVRIFFHPLDGYQYRLDRLTARALRIAEQITMLSRHSPEKYRMLREHYNVTVLSEDDRLRFRIQRTKPLVSQIKNRGIVWMSRFVLLLLWDVFLLWIFGDRMRDWLSVLFPSINGNEVLGIATVMIQLVTTLCCMIFLSRIQIIYLMMYSFCPIILIFSMGFLISENLLWIYFALIGVILAISLWIFCRKREFQWIPYLSRMLYIFKHGFLIFCLLISVIITLRGIEPYTYTSHAVTSVETSHEALEERYTQACAELKKKSFPQLLPQEKLDILQVICDYECIVVLGCDSPRVCAEWIDKDNVAGQYLAGLETIVIDVPCLTNYEPSELISLILHELRHHYQYRVAELYDKLLPFLTEQNQNIDYLREAKDFKQNYADYKDSGKDGKDAYRNQCIEQDSRNYAEKRMDEHYRYILEDRF